MKLGSSINANKHPYAKNNFKGDAFCKAISLQLNKESQTKPLMTEDEWYEFCMTKSLTNNFNHLW